MFICLRSVRAGRSVKCNMSSYPSIEYFVHDGSVYLEPRYTNVSGLALLLNEARHAAHQDMEKAVQNTPFME